MCNENLTEEATNGHGVFKKFVEDTVQAVANTENSRRGDSSSSLQVFCRVDVGVLDHQGPYHYFVSELERSLTVGLFRWTTPVVLVMLNSAIEQIPEYAHRSRGFGV